MARSCYIIHRVLERKEHKRKRKKPSKEKSKKKSKKSDIEETFEKLLESVQVEIDPRITFKYVPEKDNPAMGTQTEEILIVEGTRKTVTIGTDLEPETRVHLIYLLKEYTDVFAYSVADTPGISLDLVSHELNIVKDHCAVHQKKRSLAEKKA